MSVFALSKEHVDHVEFFWEFMMEINAENDRNDCARLGATEIDLISAHDRLE